MKLTLFLFTLIAVLTSFAETPSVTCEEIAKVTNKDELKVVMGLLHKDQTAKIQMQKAKDSIEDRHELGKLFNGCEANANSKGLVISFEGTGSYDPKTFDLYRRLIRCLDDQTVNGQVKKLLYNLVQKFIKAKARTPRWSAISAGPHHLFLQNPELRNHISSLQFTSYPSEETELLDGSNGLTLDNMKKIVTDYALSSSGIPRGIQNALSCTTNYMKSAKGQKLKPKLIILTHSSGGRSAVKFLEKLKAHKIKADLVFSMDPVKEAHEAVKEVVEQYSGNAARDLQRKFSDEVAKNKTVNVWTRSQPQVLYKVSNTLKWINVYQSVDTLGLKGPVKFGIRGSPVYKADVNQHISTNLGADAHGAIAYHEKTSELFAHYFLEMFR